MVLLLLSHEQNGDYNQIQSIKILRKSRVNVWIKLDQSSNHVLMLPFNPFGYTSICRFMFRESQHNANLMFGIFCVYLKFLNISVL